MRAVDGTDVGWSEAVEWDVIAKVYEGSTSAPTFRWRHTRKELAQQLQIRGEARVAEPAQPKATAAATAATEAAAAAATATAAAGARARVAASPASLVGADALDAAAQRFAARTARLLRSEREAALAQVLAGLNARAAAEAGGGVAAATGGGDGAGVDAAVEAAADAVVSGGSVEGGGGGGGGGSEADAVATAAAAGAAGAAGADVAVRTLRDMRLSNVQLVPATSRGGDARVLLTLRDKDAPKVVPKGSREQEREGGGREGGGREGGAPARRSFSLFSVGDVVLVRRDGRGTQEQVVRGVVSRVSRNSLGIDLDVEMPHSNARETLALTEHPA